MPSYTTLSKPSVGDPTRKEFADAVVDNFEYLKAASDSFTSAGISIPNGSFENDTDGDLIPDLWTRTLYHASSAGAIDTTTHIHGAKSFKFTSTGTLGGGYLQSTDFIPCSPNRTYLFSWQIKSGIATINNKVVVYWFKNDLTASATTNTEIYQSVNNPTSFTLNTGSTIPPSDARFFKMQLIGGLPGTATATDTWFDDVSIKVIGETVPTMDLITTLGSSTWTAPVGVTRIKVRAWGGGRSGLNNPTTSLFGGSGDYSEGYLTVTPNTGYTVVIGAAGDIFGSPGGDTTFNTSSIVAAGCNSGTSQVGTLKIRGLTISGTSSAIGSLVCVPPFSTFGSYGSGNKYGSAANQGAMIIEY